MDAQEQLDNKIRILETTHQLEMNTCDAGLFQEQNKQVYLLEWREVMKVHA